MPLIACQLIVDININTRLSVKGYIRWGGDSRFDVTLKGDIASEISETFSLDEWLSTLGTWSTRRCVIGYKDIVRVM
jgi:hypothetical protein